jgi:WD40-like Beta Propeller Repeat
MKTCATNLAFATLIILGLSIASRGQTPTPSPVAAPPSSDIFLLDVTEKRGQMRLGQPVKITDWAGYNNQPSFLPDGRSILYTSIRDKQADIYRYDLRGGETNRITNTPESEYSPTLMLDGKFISVVRVEADGTQRLWKFPLAGGPPSLVLENIKPVGYHSWLDDHTLALFILGSSGKPHTLQLVDLRTGKAEVIAENPGRILRRLPRQNKLSFVHKLSEQEWIIKAFDLKTRKITDIVKTFTGVEDYAWMPDGVLLMARDAKLFARKNSDWAWLEIADLSKAGLKSISRIAVSPKGDKIAIVAR